jgi:hypothetical protein
MALKFSMLSNGKAVRYWIGDAASDKLVYAGLTDAYAGFSKLYEVNRKAGPILAAACWAHGSLIGTRFREQCARWCPIESCQSGALCGLI